MTEQKGASRPRYRSYANAFYPSGAIGQYQQPQLFFAKCSQKADFGRIPDVREVAIAFLGSFSLPDECRFP